MDSISITKILLFFYLLVSNSLINPLLSKQWKKTIENNRLMQHMIALMTMITLAVLIDEGKNDYFTIMMYSIIGYLWFIFSTKIDIHFNMIIMAGLLGCYLYENHIKIENDKINKDSVLTLEQKEELSKKNKNKQTYLTFLIFILIIIGMFMYSNKKEEQYGGSYNLVNFLLW
jgi:hypothetical protein